MRCVLPRNTWADRQAQTRIATFLSLKDKAAGHLVHAVCTHYDDQGVIARAKSSLLIRTAIRDWVDEVEVDAKVWDKRPKAPVILFGDFSESFLAWLDSS